MCQGCKKHLYISIWDLGASGDLDYSRRAAWGHFIPLFQWFLRHLFCGQNNNEEILNYSTKHSLDFSSSLLLMIIVISLTGQNAFMIVLEFNMFHVLITEVVTSQSTHFAINDFYLSNTRKDEGCQRGLQPAQLSLLTHTDRVIVPSVGFTENCSSVSTGHIQFNITQNFRGLQTDGND